jgi:hypothetical protein
MRTYGRCFTQRSNFTIGGTEVELLPLAWHSARSKMTTNLKKGSKINIRHFMIFDIQQPRKTLASTQVNHRDTLRQCRARSRSGIGSQAWHRQAASWARLLAMA